MTVHIPHINAVDPSRTMTLRGKFVTDFRARFRRLMADIKEALVDLDVLGLVERDRVQVMQSRFNLAPREFEFKTDSEKLDAFNDWVNGKVDLYFKTGGKYGFNAISSQELGADKSDDSWMNFYIDSAYQQGIRRGRQELKKQGVDVQATGPLGTSGDGAIKAAFNTPIHANRVSIIYTRSFSKLKGITASIDSIVSDVVSIGMAEGKHPRQIASALNKALTGKGESFGIIDSLGRFIPPQRRAELLARTEVIRAHHAANMAEYKAAGILGIKVQVEYLTAGDKRVCPDCESLGKEKIFTIEEAEHLIPQHPQCVTADTVIIAPDISHVYKAKYSGELYEISFSSGERLTVTPNHMLLTPDGLVMARCFAKGMKVFNSPVIKRHSICNPNDKDNPARIDNVVSSLSESFSGSASRMPVSSIDFHGDGVFFDGDVNIIRTDSFLWSDDVTGFFNFTDSQWFQLRSVLDVLFRGSSHAKFFKTAFSAPDCFVGISREALALFRGAVLHSDNVGLTPVSWPDFIFSKDPVDYSSFDIEKLRKFFNGHPSVEFINEFILWHFNSVVSDNGSKLEFVFDEKLFDRITLFEAINSCQGKEAFASNISVVSVDNVRMFHTKSPVDVYDVSTLSTGYIANGILSSNCRCVAIPHIED